MPRLLANLCLRWHRQDDFQVPVFFVSFTFARRGDFYGCCSNQKRHRPSKAVGMHLRIFVLLINIGWNYAFGLISIGDGVSSRRSMLRAHLDRRGCSFKNDVRLARLHIVRVSEG